MKKSAIRLWVAYLLTGFPLTIFGYLFTGGGTPQFAFLDDYSNPGVTFAWTLGAVLIFLLPLAAITLTGVLLLSRFRKGS